ncbi:uncharacterized protein BDZ99DRAFT_456739 [Mytilinidion resinicola]|uniref:Large ribosomal subunit protein mL67 n=1 Tax=Mytilinidion resinicola TaxID=574789 RepID=A0A6A6Z9I0_9PEZI|nr:uncharacterized protein BDZ99DRAFT_456739 [Mytilinidion resinicola]KAF2816935.1 hypothetical protein BDZ99DRAFT_456739 [Mytilinidion resinicola]
MPRTANKLAIPKRFKHGQHIFFWKEIHTNQVLYSFTRQLDDSLLEQIPFIGKNSKPPTIRPDLWTPLLTVFFPSDKQGLVAYRMLREFRRLHETSWDKNNPEIKRMEKKKRIHWIKDQKANSIADLAKVLSMFKDQAPKLEEMARNKRAEVEKEALKRWEQVKRRAAKADAGELSKIEREIESLKTQRARKTGDKERQRLDRAINIWRMQYASLKKSQKQVLKFQEEEERIAKKKEAERQARIVEMADKLPDQEASEKLPPGEASPTVEPLPTIEKLPVIEEGGKLPKFTVLPENQALAKIVPIQFQKPVPAPMSIDGVVVQWAHLTDAEHALGSWPTEVLHAEMGHLRRFPPLPEDDPQEFPLNEEEGETMRLARLEHKRRNREKEEAKQAERLANKLAAKAKHGEKAGILGRFIPKLPFFGNKAPRRAQLEQ